MIDNEVRNAYASRFSGGKDFWRDATIMNSDNPNYGINGTRIQYPYGNDLPPWTRAGASTEQRNYERDLVCPRCGFNLGNIAIHQDNGGRERSVPYNYHNPRVTVGTMTDNYKQLNRVVRDFRMGISEEDPPRRAHPSLSELLRRDSSKEPYWYPPQSMNEKTKDSIPKENFRRAPSWEDVFGKKLNFRGNVSRGNITPKRFPSHGEDNRRSWESKDARARGQQTGDGTIDMSESRLYLRDHKVVKNMRECWEHFLQLRSMDFPFPPPAWELCARNSNKTPTDQKSKSPVQSKIANSLEKSTLISKRLGRCENEELSCNIDQSFPSGGDNTELHRRSVLEIRNDFENSIQGMPKNPKNADVELRVMQEERLNLRPTIQYTTYDPIADTRSGHGTPPPPSQQINDSIPGVAIAGHQTNTQRSFLTSSTMNTPIITSTINQQIPVTTHKFSDPSHTPIAPQQQLNKEIRHFAPIFASTQVFDTNDQANPVTRGTDPPTSSERLFEEVPAAPQNSNTMSETTTNKIYNPKEINSDEKVEQWMAKNNYIGTLPPPPDGQDSHSLPENGSGLTTGWGLLGDETEDMNIIQLGTRTGFNLASEPQHVTTDARPPVPPLYQTARGSEKAADNEISTRN